MPACYFWTGNSFDRLWCWSNYDHGEENSFVLLFKYGKKKRRVPKNKEIEEARNDLLMGSVFFHIYLPFSVF